MKAKIGYYLLAAFIAKQKPERIASNLAQKK